jgi:pSer/pThr/pTyr-binding forkhead associated (FHA) protein
MWESMQTENPDASVPFPADAAGRPFELVGDVVLIGRRSDKAAVFPDIDLADPGVSRKHATLHRQADGSWSARDEGSTNGTRVNDGADPVPPGSLVPLADGDRLFVGAFTRITIRRAG